MCLVKHPLPGSQNPRPWPRKTSLDGVPRPPKGPSRALKFLRGPRSSLRRCAQLPPRYSLTGSWGPVHKSRIPFQAPKTPSPAAECQFGWRPQAPKRPPKGLIGLAWAPVLAPTLLPGRRTEKLPPWHSLTSLPHIFIWFHTGLVMYVLNAFRTMIMHHPTCWHARATPAVTCMDSVLGPGDAN